MQGRRSWRTVIGLSRYVRQMGQKKIQIIIRMHVKHIESDRERNSFPSSMSNHQDECRAQKGKITCLAYFLRLCQRLLSGLYGHNVNRPLATLIVPFIPTKFLAVNSLSRPLNNKTLFSFEYNFCHRQIKASFGGEGSSEGSSGDFNKNLWLQNLFFFQLFS